MKISVIITTYNSPEWLEKVLWGYRCQTFGDFELLIADDGSGADTANVIHNLQPGASFPIRHIWHEDQGFRKCVILNKAIQQAQAEYVVFSDGDCIPRADFLQVHFERRKKNCFLSGGAIRLPMELSKLITPAHIICQQAFDKEWLIENGLKSTAFKNLKLTDKKTFAQWMNKITPTKATWNGGNASIWKKNIMEVNGFDERMRYGAEDREFGERLVNNGLKGIQIRYSAVCIHLEHSRGYVNKPDLERNAAIRKETRQYKIIRTRYGIQKEHPEVAT